MIREFYAFADRELSGEAEQAMRAYLAANRGDRYGKFRYSTELIDGDLAALHDEFAAYRQRYDIAIEQRG